MKINKGFLHAAIYVLAIIFLGFSIFRIFLMPSEIKATSAAPLFTSIINDPEGKPQSLKQFQNKTIVLNFWATWCPPCREEMPELSAMQEQYKGQNFLIVGLSTDDLEQTKKFIKTAPVSYPILAGDTDAMNLAESLGNDRGILPYTVIVDTKGAVVKTFFGRVNQQLLEKTITPLLNVSAAK